MSFEVFARSSNRERPYLRSFEMRLFASRLLRTVKLGLAPCFVLALLIGCEQSGPAVPTAPKDAAVAPPKAEPLSPQEKRKVKGAARAASGAQPAGAE
jgi:hypothetical protein